MDAEIERALNSLKQEVADVRGEVAGMHRLLLRVQREVSEHDTVLSKEGIAQLRQSVERLIVLIDGDERMDVNGLRERLEKVESRTVEIINQRNMLKWILIGMGLTGLTNAGALITVLIKVLGGGP